MNNLKLPRPASTPFASKNETCDPINSPEIVIEGIAGKSFHCSFLRFFLHYTVYFD